MKYYLIDKEYDFSEGSHGLKIAFDSKKDLYAFLEERDGAQKMNSIRKMLMSTTLENRIKYKCKKGSLHSGRTHAYGYRLVIAIDEESYKSKEDQLRDLVSQNNMPSCLVGTPIFKKHFDSKLDSLYIAYAKAYNAGKYTRGELLPYGITKNSIELVGGMQELSRASRENHPELFVDIVIDEYYTAEYVKNVSDVVSNNKKNFIITTAVANGKVDESLLSSLKTFCKVRDAAILIMLVADNQRDVADGYKIDRRLLPDDNFKDIYFIFEHTALNSNLMLCTIKASTKMKNPLLDLASIAQTMGKSLISASPKQDLHSVPIGNRAMPHMVMTTGAVTKPYYTSKEYMSQRLVYIAHSTQIMGAIIVEIKDDTVFFFRQLQANNEDGSITDLGVKYLPDGTWKNNPPEYLVEEHHTLATQPDVKQCFFNIARNTGACGAVEHDIFDGISVNPHESVTFTTKSSHFITLEEELLCLVKELEELVENYGNIVIVASNHNEFLKRYLDRGAYKQEPCNHNIGLVLDLAYSKGNDPLKYAVEVLFDFKYKDRLLWLERDEDFTVGGYQLGAHGDLGPNGSRGSVPNTRRAYSRSISGHTHVPWISGNTISIGTTTYLKLAYNRGPSSWMHGCALVYLDGSRQLVIPINGEYTTFDMLGECCG